MAGLAKERTLLRARYPLLNLALNWVGISELKQAEEGLEDDGTCGAR